MKTIEETETETRVPDEPISQIDTSGMSKGQKEALELTEAAREESTRQSFFARDLFLGSPLYSTLYPFPAQPSQDIEDGTAFLSKLEEILRERTDPDAIDREGEIPDSVLAGLAEIGAFGIKIPKKYGGLGLSQTNYSRAAMLLGSHCGNLTALLSAHQSIGVPQPLLLFGSEEQKERFLPRMAAGEISAFALTENDVGSDPAQMTTTATPASDGESFVLNGEKLWCTNGTKAGVIVVMARTPDKLVGGKKKKQITAFVVEMNTPGVEVVQRCRFMGLKALYNGVVRFDDAVVPRGNILSAEGKGLKVALTTLNTGRITLPAACVGLSKRCLNIARRWSAERKQWGAAIGKHAAIADKIARMASDVFIMESMVLLVSELVDRKNHDIRVEAAMAKLWGTETAWRIVDDTMQIRGGRGYETADSLRARGEEPMPVERIARDSRINLIFEGSSEIMRLFLAREALDPHLKVAGEALDSRRSSIQRLRAASRAALFYGRWYPSRWLPFSTEIPSDLDESLRPHLKFVSTTSRRLARSLFHAMAFYGPGLEKQQCLLARFVDIGTELFALTAATLRADTLLKNPNPTNKPDDLQQLLDFILELSKQKIRRRFAEMRNPNDKRGYRLAQQVLDEGFEWLEDGIV